MADEGSDKSMQELWVSVEEPGELPHVRSSEEVAELIADAASEEEGSFETETVAAVKSQFIEKEEIYSFKSPPLYSNEDQHSSASCLKSFIWTMFTPPFIISHLAVFLIGVLIGRRMLS